MSRSQTVRIESHAEPQEVGKAIRIVASTNELYPETQSIYVPISTVHEIHPDCIVMDQWMADKKDLVY